MIAFISGGELVVVFFVVLLLFGAKSIPDIAKSIGKGMREFRKVSDDIRSEINQDGITDTFKDIGNQVNDTVSGRSGSNSKKGGTSGKEDESNRAHEAEAETTQESGRQDTSTDEKSGSASEEDTQSAKADASNSHTKS